MYQGEVSNSFDSWKLYYVLSNNLTTELLERSVYISDLNIFDDNHDRLSTPDTLR